MDNAKRVVVLGKFDGVHRGHMALLKRARELADKNKIEVIVYVIGLSPAKTITNDTEKENILKRNGADKVIFKNFDSEFRAMLPTEFVDKIVSGCLRAAYVVVGKNFRFGKDRTGDAELLKALCKKHNIEVYAEDTVRMISPDGTMEDVSSSAIRRYISQGKMECAVSYLGRPYKIKGIVTEGKKLGRQMGFPTINILPPRDFLDVKRGVYATNITVDGKSYRGITNVGLNPTVDSREEVITETHIPDAAVDCYGKEAELEFLKFIREEQKFSTLCELISKLKEDEKQVKKYWGESQALTPQED